LKAKKKKIGGELGMEGFWLLARRAEAEPPIRKTYSLGQKKKPSNLVEGQIEGLSNKELQFYYSRCALNLSTTFFLMTNTTENTYLPDWVSPPGETLADILKEREIPIRVFANRMGMTRKETYRLMKGEIEITTRIAYKMELALWIPSARFWIERERLYRESLANQNQC
jgi:plasmid maintenance system antidote protein VapI